MWRSSWLLIISLALALAVLIFAAMFIFNSLKPGCKGTIGCSQGIIATMSSQATKTEKDYHGTPTATEPPEGHQFRSTPVPTPNRTNWWGGSA